MTAQDLVRELKLDMLPRVLSAELNKVENINTLQNAGVTVGRKKSGSQRLTIFESVHKPHSNPISTTGMSEISWDAKIVPAIAFPFEWEYGL
jgi:hypothetical protein